MHHWFQLDSISCLTGFHKMLKYSYSISKPIKVGKARGKLQVCHQDLFGQLLNLKSLFSLKPWMIPIVAEQKSMTRKSHSSELPQSFSPFPTSPDSHWNLLTKHFQHQKNTELKQKTTVLCQVIDGYPNMNVPKNTIQSSTEKFVETFIMTDNRYSYYIQDCTS